MIILRSTGPDLHAAVQEVVRHRRNFPVALPDALRLGEEVRHLAGVDLLLEILPLLQDFLYPPAKLPVQLRNEGDRLGRKDLGVLLEGWRP